MTLYVRVPIKKAFFKSNASEEGLSSKPDQYPFGIQSTSESVKAV